MSLTEGRTAWTRWLQPEKRDRWETGIESSPERKYNDMQVSG